MNDLTTGEMSQVSGGWITPGAARAAILAKPALGAMLPSVEAAHHGLREVAPDNDAPARLKELAVEGQASDQRHDSTIRGSHMVLTGLSILADDEAERAQILALLAFLLPDGLQAIQKTYRGEAGAAELLLRRLAEEPARVAQVEAMVLPIAGGTALRTFVDRWTSEATRLGAIDDERVALTTAAPGAAAVVTPAEARAARLDWMNQVRAMIAVAKAIKLSPEEYQVIFGNLEAAEATAARRGRAPAAKPEKAQPVKL